MTQSKVAVFVGSSRPGSVNRKLARALVKLGGDKLAFEIVEIDNLHRSSIPNAKTIFPPPRSA